MSLNSALITTWIEFEALENIWDDLLIQSDADNIFLRWDWINCWRKSADKPYIPSKKRQPTTGSIQKTRHGPIV